MNPWDAQTGAEPDLGQDLCPNCNDEPADPRDPDRLGRECAIAYEMERAWECDNDR